MQGRNQQQAQGANNGPQGSVPDLAGDKRVAAARKFAEKKKTLHDRISAAVISDSWKELAHDRVRCAKSFETLRRLDIKIFLGEMEHKLVFDS